MQCAAVIVFVVGLLQDANGLAVEESLVGRADAAKPTMLSTLSTVLGAIGFIKLKIMLVLVAAFFVVGILSKLLGGLGAVTCGGLGIACPPGQGGINTYSTGAFSYSQPDYSTFDTYRAHSDPDFIGSIARSIDFMDISLKMFGVEDAACKKKFVCMAENEALQNPFLGFAIKFLGSNLTKYQDFGSAKQKKKDCNSLYPECKAIIPNNIKKEFENFGTMLSKPTEDTPTTVILQNTNFPSAKL